MNAMSHLKSEQLATMHLAGVIIVQSISNQLCAFALCEWDLSLLIHFSKKSFSALSIELCLELKLRHTSVVLLSKLFGKKFESKNSCLRYLLCVQNKS